MPENINVKETKKLLEDFQRSKDTIEKHELEKFFEYFAEIFILYEKEKERKGIDYADLLINFKKIKDKPQYKFVLIDELQDVNRLEAEIALDSGKTFFAVGDKKQAIFGFQGGSIENFALFKQKKPLEVNLILNRRSTQQILDFAALDFKSKTTDEESRQELEGLKNYRGEQGEKPVLIEAEKGDSIGKVCGLLNELEGETAVIVRTNQQILEISKELENRNLEFSSTFLSASKEAKENIIKFLKAVFSQDVNDLKNAFFTPFFPITMQKAFELTKNNELTVDEILEECPEFRKLRENQKDIETVSELFKERIFPVSMAYGTDYLLSAQSLLESVQEALKLIDDKTLDNFLRYLEAVDLQASTAKKDAKLVLTTVHKAKGMQYENVIYIPKKTKNKRAFYDYIVEKILEQNGGNIETELEEEALRIDFVAFTRAKKKLYVITEKPRDYLNENIAIGDVESENTAYSFEEKQKRAYNLFVNRQYEEAKKLLETDNKWLKEFVQNHFNELEHISFSRLTTNAYEYFTRNILKLQQSSYALNLGSEVHDLLEKYLKGETPVPSEEAKEYFENGVELIKNIKKEYPSFVEAEHELYIPLKELIGTGEKVHFKGFIDAIFKNENGYLIVDWKTSKNTGGASSYRRQLELYKRAYCSKQNIPLDKVKVAIGFVGLRKIINDGTVLHEYDDKQPRKNVFDTVKKHFEKFLEWKENPEKFLQEIAEESGVDPLIGSVIEQIERE